MKLKTFLVTALCSSALYASDDALSDWIHSGNVYGNVKYYFINTRKDNDGAADTSAYANTLGGQLSYTTGSLYGFDAGVTLMTTEPFALPNAAKVDASVIGNDNGVHGGDKTASISVLGRAYLNYTHNDYQIWIGRQTPKSPLINAKDVRMIPSAVSGAQGRVLLDYGFTVTAAYLDAFKQRTSSQFENIVKHALGDNMLAVTGKKYGYVVPVSLTWENKNFLLRLYDYYSPDFMNSIYADAKFKDRLGSKFSYTLAVQGISQSSIGNADTNLQKAGSISDGKKISTSMYGALATFAYSHSKLSLAYTNVLSDDTSHDSLVLPWDGTPLFTNMITSNNLFQSKYGSGLNADSAYIGGTEGIKLAYSQNYNFIGLNKVSSALSTAMYKNDNFASTQRDYNAVLSYHTNVFSLALKGIWVYNNTGAAANGTISQIPMLAQYRVIANYKF